MVSIKTIAEGLSRQIEAAIEGKANEVQADVLCKSVDSLIRLARLQIDMGAIDWSQSDELPVIQMEKVSADAGALSRLPKAPEIELGKPAKDFKMAFTAETMEVGTESALQAEIKNMEVELSHAEVAQGEAADGSGDFIRHEKRCKQIRKYIRELRDELEGR